MLVQRRGGHRLPLVRITSRSNLLDQERPVIQIGEGHAPASDSKAIALLLAAFETADIAATRPSELVNRAKDSLLCWLVEVGERLQGLPRPLNRAITSTRRKDA